MSSERPANRFTAEVQGSRMIYVLVTDHGDSGETYSVGPFSDNTHDTPRPRVAAAFAAQVNAAAAAVPVEPDGRVTAGLRMLAKMYDQVPEKVPGPTIPFARNPLKDQAAVVVAEFVAEHFGAARSSAPPTPDEEPCGSFRVTREVEGTAAETVWCGRRHGPCPLPGTRVNNDRPCAAGPPPAAPPTPREGTARRFVALDDHEAEAALNAALPTGFYTPAAVIRSLNEADVVLVRDVPA